MRITATIIMRNEAVLIASKIAACCTWADEVVVVDQRSEDGSAFIAKENCVCAGLPVASKVFHELDKEIRFTPLVKEGQVCKQQESSSWEDALTAVLDVRFRTRLVVKVNLHTT